LCVFLSSACYIRGRTALNALRSVFSSHEKFRNGRSLRKPNPSPSTAKSCHASRRRPSFRAPSKSEWRLSLSLHTPARRSAHRLWSGWPRLVLSQSTRTSMSALPARYRRLLRAACPSHPQAGPERRHPRRATHSSPRHSRPRPSPSSVRTSCRSNCKGTSSSRC